MAKYKFTMEQEQKICQKYLDGLSTCLLAKEYNCNPLTISNILKRNNHNTRTILETNKKYSLDESYFDIIDCEDKAYFLGWMYSDGYNVSKYNTAGLKLQEKDKYILEIFKKYVKTNKDLYYIESKTSIYPNKEYYTCQPSYCLNMISKHMVNSLIKLGCVPRKSLILTFPSEDQVPEEYIPYFIRGVFEGDGWVCFNDNPKDKNYSINVGMMGTYEFLKKIEKYFNDNNIKKVNIYKKDENSEINTWVLTVSNILDVLNFKKLIYNITNPELILNRKYNKLIKIQDYAEKKLDIKRLIYLESLNTKESLDYINDLYLNQKLTPYVIAKKLNVTFNFIRKRLKLID